MKVQIRNLGLTYPPLPGKGKDKGTGIEAFRNISLTLAEGERCTVLGPSGCGKTSLLHALAGVVRPTAGEVLADGTPLRPATHRIGLVPQDYGLLPWKTLYGNMLLGLRLRGLHPESFRKEMNEIMNGLGIGEIRDRYPAMTSGGQRQRAALARAFVPEPELLLMDEPFSALDAITREEIQDLFLGMWKKHPVTTLFVTHSIEEALYLGQTIVVLRGMPGQVDRILSNPVPEEEDRRLCPSFYQACMDMRQVVRNAWEAGS